MNQTSSPYRTIIQLGLILCLLLRPGLRSLHAQEGARVDVEIKEGELEERLSRIKQEYDEQRFEDAYELFVTTYNGFYTRLGDAGKITMLDWGIRLSFITEELSDLDRYIGQYYGLDPYFSAGSLKESSPQLQAYVSNYVKAKSERFVYVNKRKQNIDYLPASIDVYTREDIDRLGARNILDLIRITPGFVELGDNNERIIGTRGTSSTSLQDILILINGHRISDVFTNTNAPDWLSLDYVKQVEFMRGPGSALYGENAFSGVINIITEDARYKNINRVSVNTGTGNDFRNVGLEQNTYHLNYQYGRKLSNNEAFYLSTSFYSSGGAQVQLADAPLQTVLPDVVRLDSNGPNGQVLFDTLRAADVGGVEYINRYQPSYNILLNYHRRSARITANAQSSSFVYQRPTTLNVWSSYQPNDERSRVRTDRREFVHFEYSFMDRGGQSPHDLRLKLGGDHFHKDIYFPARSFGIGSNQRVVGDEYRGTASLEFSSDSLMNELSFLGDQYFLAGLEGYFNHWLYNYYLASDSGFVLEETGDFFSEPDETRLEYVAAAFIQVDQNIIQDRLVATAGVRFNYHSKYSTFRTFEWGEQYSPRFALIYLSPENKKGLQTFRVKALYNSAFFPPPFLYRRGGIFGFQGSADLSVQKIESGELAISGDLPYGFGYNAQFYVNKIEDVIERVYIPTLDRDVYINSPRAQRNAGMEMELNHTWEGERISANSFANFSYVSRSDFINENNYTYFDLFDQNNFIPGEQLFNYPTTKAVIGADLTVKSLLGVEEDNRGNYPQLLLGMNVQRIGVKRVQATYQISDENALEHTVFDELNTIELPAAIVLDARVRFIFERSSFGLSAYNLGDERYFLPNLSYNSRMQFGESRMIMFNFSYLFNTN